MKSKSPADCADNRQGHQTHAIARMSQNNSIVSQSPEKGKAHGGLSQLRE